MPSYNLFVSRVHVCNAIVPVLVFNIGNSLVIRTSVQWNLGSNPVFHLRGGQAHGLHIFSDATFLLSGTWVSGFIRHSSVVTGLVGAQQHVDSSRHQVSLSFCAFCEFWVSCSS